MAKGTWRDKCAECDLARAGAAGTDLCWPCLRAEACCPSPAVAAQTNCGCRGQVGALFAEAGSPL